MKAIILAGGFGTRLRPLTEHLPKPLVPLLNKPAMAYSIDLLHRHGIYDISVTLAFLPHKIREAFGASLVYFEEDRPLGTAGSVLKAREFLKETFVVLSGDALTDVDLTAAIAFHRRKGAVATLVLTHADDPQPFGGVVLGREGKIEHFIEKPDWAGVASDLVNTGIYVLEPEVLELIGEGSFDFGRDLFPEMLHEGLPMYGYVMQDYWCDIGDVGAYLQAQHDLLHGRVNRPQGQIRLPDTRIGQDVTLASPCCVGRGCVLADGAQILADTVLGDCVYVGAGAVVEKSVLFPGVHIEAGARLYGCIVMDGAQVGRNAQIDAQAVVGSGCVIGENSAVSPGVRIWPGHCVKSGQIVRANLRDTPAHRFSCEASKISGVFLPEELCSIGAAFVRALNVHRLCVIHDKSLRTLLPLEAFVAGAASAGAQVVCAGCRTAAGLFCAAQEGCDAAAAADICDGSIRIALFSRSVPLTGAQMNQVRRTLEQMDFPRVPYDKIAPPILRDQAQSVYDAWKKSLEGAMGAFYDFYGDADDAGNLTLYDPDGLPIASPVAQEMIRRAAAYYGGAQEGLYQTMCMLDASLALQLLGHYLERTDRTIGQLLLECGAGVGQTDLACEDRLKGAAMRRFLDQLRGDGAHYVVDPDGVKVEKDGAKAVLAPKTSSAIGIQVRAMSQEFAQEWMGQLEAQLKTILNGLTPN